MVKDRATEGESHNHTVSRFCSPLVFILYCYTGHTHNNVGYLPVDGLQFTITQFHKISEKVAKTHRKEARAGNNLKLSDNGGIHE